MGSVSVWLLSLVLYWGLPSPHTTLSYAAVYYVTPHSPNPDCPSGEPCLTLNEYAQGNHFNGTDNITLLFLNGEHNLTTQSLDFEHKALLKMAPVQTEVRIQLTNGTDIIVEKVIEVEISGLRFVGMSQDCLSIAGFGHFLVFSTSIESCQLVLKGELNDMATITEYSAATNSCICSSSSQGNQTVAITNSEFHLSTVSITDFDSLIHHNLIGDAIHNSLSVSLENSSMKSSNIEVRLRSPNAHELVIRNTNFTGENSGTTQGTMIAINIEISTATLYAHVRNCNITGNYQGIKVVVVGPSHMTLNVDNCHIAYHCENDIAEVPGIGITAFGNSSVEFNIDRCYIANYEGPDYNHTVSYNNSGGIVFSGNYAINIINITFTTFVGNYIQVAGSSAMTTVTVFNCKIRGRKQHSIHAGIWIHVGRSASKCIFINITKNCIKDAKIAGIYIDSLPKKLNESSTCPFEAHLSDNTISSFSLVKQPLNPYLYEYGLQVYNLNNTNNQMVITNCLFINNKNTAIFLFNTSGIVTITETVFLQNLNGIQIVDFTLPANITINVKNSTFLQNVGGIIINCQVPGTQVAINLADTKFQENRGVSFEVKNFRPKNIYAGNRINLTIGDLCVFQGNQGTPIQALWTTVSLSGVVTFENNTAYQGGAISLSLSMLRLVSINHTKTSVIFANNSATRTGGAIYIDSSVIKDPDTTSNCFYEIQGVSDNEVEDFIVLDFINNTATDGGNDIYGATPNSNCTISFPKKREVRSSKIKAIFRTDSSLSPISSDPKRVCLCDSSQLMCANLSHIFYNTTRYPGEVFPLSLAVVGLDFGTVTDPVYAYLLNSLSSLGSGERVRTIHAGISQLNFTINSQNSREVIVLTVNRNVVTEVASKAYISSIIPSSTTDTIPLDLLTVSVYINVTLYGYCPPGFKLDNGTCKCNTLLKHTGNNNCFIYNNTAYIHRSRNQWINSTQISEHCPFHYCKQNITQLNVNNPDDQCALDHTGVLCGACPHNLGLAIGSSRCLECSDNNYHTMLLIAFAGAGILLVLFIKILDITVTVGTINGLIFYANIIWANQSVLFPPPAQTSSRLRFLKTFIAWLNLDLGIETCFIQHLDGYWKTWLQFVFPAYIWLIVGLIILASHYSVRITKVLGNSVSVLATIFLLSYAKLLCTIFIVMDFTVLESNDSQRFVWSFDGNISYFSLKHSILFVMAVIVLLVLSLPYTFSLLFIQCLRRHSDRRLLRWVNKLTPLFDSYLGPLKDKHHYWIGLGLLARLVLLLTSTVTLPIITALIIILTAFTLGALVVNVYKQWQLSLLEGCFLFNMVMFCSGALVTDLLGKSKDSLACTSLGITFILFLAIIGYHVWRRLRSLKRKNIRNGYEKIDNDSIQTPPQNPPPCQPTTYQEVFVPPLRDSILESIVD